MIRSDFKRLFIALAVALLVPALAAAQVDTGEADFSTYVALGDSLTQAVVSGSIGEVGQRASYPLQIAEAVGVAGGFEQPLVSEPGIPGRLVLTSLAPLDVGQIAGIGVPLNVGLERPYNNLGVAGAEVEETINRAGGDLPHDLVLRGIAPALVQAIGLAPTFATVWLGNNDVLEAAVAGIVVEGETLTDPAEFAADYFTVVRALDAAGAQLAVANIPPVTAIPFVNTIPPVVTDPLTRQPVTVGGRTVPLIGPDGPLGAGDNVLLSAAGELARGRGIPAELGGSGQPLGDEHVLDAGEAARIAARVEELNSTIRAAAASVGAAFVDAHQLFTDALANGLLLGGIEYDVGLTGGLFSFDGVHPSPLGYGIVANAFIDAINNSFDASIPNADLFRFVLGPDGDLGPRGQLVLTSSAAELTESLWTLLDLPSKRKLKRLARRQRRQQERRQEGSAESSSLRRPGGGEHEGRSGAAARRPPAPERPSAAAIRDAFRPPPPR